MKMALVALWCTVTSIVFYLLSFPFNKRKWLSWAYAKSLNFGVRIALGIKVKIHGRENMIAGPAVITMNHQSNFDPLLQGPVFPKNTVIIGKETLLKIPFWGRLFKATNNILVTRRKDHATGGSKASNHTKNGAGVREVISRLKRDNCFVWIFPEGTRSPTGSMGKFKQGAFVMAISAQVPIIPMVSKPMQAVLDIPNKIAKGGLYEITILPAISTTGMTLEQLPELIGRCEMLYESTMLEYKQRALLH